MAPEKPCIGITMGDPAGVGAEVIVKAYPRLRSVADVIVIGDADVVEDAVRIADSPLSVNVVDSPAAAEFSEATIDVLDLDNVDEIEYGTVREEYGRASLEYVETAIELARNGDVDGITTAPINKQATELAGSEYNGHTGMLADYTDTENYSMLLIEDDLRVSHVSTHVSLREACDRVTEENVVDTVRVTHEALTDVGVADPTIAVAGLNPHASDGGLLGDAEAAEIRPAVERARAEGIDARGPESPDTIFVRAARGDADCVVAMYHDQGHIPIKMLGFRDGSTVSGVNVTIGLPIVRTSVDHGTAFDIAGEGFASPASMEEAVDVAVQLVEQ